MDTATVTSYRSHSRFSDPGDQAAMLDALPDDLASMRNATSSLVFHYMGGGDWAQNGIDPGRRGEIDLRYAERMLGRLGELQDGALTEPRPAARRIVGCCRDFTLLFVSMLRQKGIPARSRVGFATYFIAGWAMDHVVAEVWDADEGRWRLIDPELAPQHADPTDNATFDALDVPRDRFIVAPDAWLRCREGVDDPDRYLVSPYLDLPGLRGYPYLLHNLVHDLAALNKHEMILWDDWGLSAEWEAVTDEHLLMLDETARAMLRSDVTLEDLHRLYDRDEFRVPDVVTSYTSAVENPPIEVIVGAG